MTETNIFARWAMRGEKEEKQDSISEVGMKSRLKEWVEWSG